MTLILNVSIIGVWRGAGASWQKYPPKVLMQQRNNAIHFRYVLRGEMYLDSSRLLKISLSMKLNRLDLSSCIIAVKRRFFSF